LQFTIWNANENSYTGSYQCIDSVDTVAFGAADSTGMVARSNFDFSTLRTPNARFQVSGVASTQCPKSETAGLLGVVTSSMGIEELLPGSEDVELGSTTQTAGSQVGFVKWDPANGTVPALKTH